MEFEHEAALTSKEVMIAIRDYLAVSRNINLTKKNIRCIIEYKGEVVIFKWNYVKDEKKKLDEILGVK